MHERTVLFYPEAMAADTEVLANKVVGGKKALGVASRDVNSLHVCSVVCADDVPLFGRTNVAKYFRITWRLIQS